MALCRHKKLYRACAGLWTDALADDPKLGSDIQFGDQYNAACFASLAAAGQGEDAGMLDAQERMNLRKQPLHWLHADLALWSEQLEHGSPDARATMLSTMKHWQQDADLNGICDASALAKLPEEERQAFTQLWADVAELLKKAEEK